MTEELDMFDSRSVSSSEGEDDSPRPVVAAARRPFKVPIRIQNRESPVVLQHKKEEEEEETPPLTPKAKRPLFKSCHKKIRRIKFVAPNRHEKKLAEETIVSEEPAVPEEEDDDDDERVVVFAPKKRKKFKAASRKEGAAPAILRHQALELCPGTKVPPLICQFLRPHQRDGVQFLFDCVTGRRDYPESVEKGFGAILADGMGLGKTLQTIALLYTLLQSNQVRRIVVVCPCSLVGNWESEFEKWINSKTSNKSERLEVRGLDGSKAQTEVTIEQFLGASRPFHVLVSSYETLRANVERFARQKSNGCDLLVADEAQRLKGAKTQVNLAISRLASCKKRILLTGTPLQNDLEEFHAMADVANPGTLGSIERFRQRYVKPIVASREPDATPEQVKLGKKRQRKLAILSKCFVLRRENRLNAIHLPPKLDLVLCCAMPPAQQYAYEQTLNDKQCVNPIFSQ